MKVLLEKGYDVNALDYRHEAELWVAIASREGREVEMIKLLLAHGADVNTRDSQGAMVFHARLSIYNAEIAELFIKHGASLRARRKKRGKNTLHLAAYLGCAETIPLLLQHGDADYCYSRDGSGHTPLHLAVRSGKFKTVEVLLDYGVCAHTRDHEGETPLMLVMRHPQHLVESQTLIEFLKDHVCVRKGSAEIPGICI